MSLLVAGHVLHYNVTVCIICWVAGGLNIRNIWMRNGGSEIMPVSLHTALHSPCDRGDVIKM